MSTIVTRAGKGAPLTHNEVDANFTNLNADKYQAGDDATFGTVSVTGTVDGRDISTDGAKLDGIEAGATADQTITAGAGLTGGGTGDVTLSHADTSSQASVNNSNGVVIQDVTLDTYGHVTGLASVDLDGRYYTESEADIRFVNVTGDTMTGDLSFGSQTGTWISSSSMADSIGWNPSSGVYIGSNTLGYSSYLRGNGTFTNNAGTYSLFHDGYHPNADKLTTARNIALTGAVTGNANFDGSGNISIAATANDGSGSGLDADLLDGQHGSYYYPASNPNGYTTNVGDITGVTAGSGLTGGGTSGTVTVSHADTSAQGSVNNSNNVVIQDVTLDTYGHVTGLASRTIIAPTVNGTSGQTLISNGTATPTWGDAAAGATGGGSDKIFWENDQTVTTSYTITNGQNAMSAGPITINSGVTVTVGSGETWTVV